MKQYSNYLFARSLIFILLHTTNTYGMLQNPDSSRLFTFNTNHSCTLEISGYPRIPCIIEFKKNQTFELWAYALVGKEVVTLCKIIETKQFNTAGDTIEQAQDHEKKYPKLLDAMQRTIDKVQQRDRLFYKKQSLFKRPKENTQTMLNKLSSSPDSPKSSLGANSVKN